MKQKALDLIPDLLEILMKQVKDNHDLHAARLIAEIAGVSKRTVGRPGAKRRDDQDLTEKEVADRTDLAGEVVDTYGG